MTVSISLQFQPAAHRFRPWVPSLVSGSFLCLGLVYTFYPTLLSGLAKLQNDPGDTRFIHYLLEHSYRWLSGDPSHPKLWDPPFFFPLPNALAFSDTFLTLAPAYWFWRLVGFRPEIAFLLWMMVLCALNYVAAQALIRHGIGVRTIGADFGAFLIAFGNSRIAQLSHQQLLAHFYTLVAILALLMLFRRQSALDSVHPRYWIALFFACFVAQFYAGYYYGYFLFLGLLIAGIWAIIVRRFRVALLAFLRQQWRPLAVGAALSLLLLAPLANRYGLTAREFGWRGPEVGVPGLARLQSYFLMGPENLLYGWTARLAWFHGLPYGNEQCLGLGAILTGVLIWFLWRYRRLPGVWLVSLTVLAAMVAFTIFPGRVYLWRIWYYTLPGIQGIRAMARMGILLLIPAGTALAMLVHRYRHRPRWRWVVLVVAILCCCEQMRFQSAYDGELFQRRTSLIQERVSKECQAFFVSAQSPDEPSYLSVMDAMWASMLTGVPVINGHSGVYPDNDLFWHPVIRKEDDIDRLERALSAWCDRYGLDRARVCWIRIELPTK